MQKRIMVLDTETTGDQETDQVIELAVTHLWQVEQALPREPVWEEANSHWDLICPTVPISIGARAVHHITDEELEDKPTMDEMIRSKRLNGLLAVGHPGDYYVAAHNIAFDVAMLEQSISPHVDPAIYLPPKRICTWKCAQHLYPDLEKHGNQYLRYALGLDEKFGPLNTDLPPHRALPDTLVTSWLVREMLETKTPDELVELTTKRVLQTVCRIGQHRGKSWAEVRRTDSGFLQWMLRQGDERIENGIKKGFDPDTMHTVRTLLFGENYGS